MSWGIFIYPENLDDCNIDIVRKINVYPCYTIQVCPSTLSQDKLATAAHLLFYC